MTNRWKKNWKENETEKHKTWGFSDHVFFKKKSEEFKECEKDDFSYLLFFQVFWKDKNKKKRKHKGTFLSQRTNKEGTQFLLKTETVTKGSNSKHIAFLWRRESKKERKNDDQTKQRNQKKRSTKRDQQRKTFKNENKKRNMFQKKTW